MKAAPRLMKDLKAMLELKDFESFIKVRLPCKAHACIGYIAGDAVSSGFGGFYTKKHKNTLQKHFRYGQWSVVFQEH